MAEGDVSMTTNDENGYPCPKDGAVLTLIEGGAWCPECHTVWREVGEVDLADLDALPVQPLDGLGGGDDGAHRSVMPLCGEDRIARHFGWVKGVPHCPVGVICEHGWVLTQKIVDGWAEAEKTSTKE